MKIKMERCDVVHTEWGKGKDCVEMPAVEGIRAGFGRLPTSDMVPGSILQGYKSGRVSAPKDWQRSAGFCCVFSILMCNKALKPVRNEMPDMLTDDGI